MRRSPRPAAGETAARSAITLVVLVLALGAAPAARAQWNDIPRLTDTTRPSLAGHTFVSTDLIPDAFVRTYVRTSLGYAEAQSVDYPPVVVGGDSLQILNGSLTYATLGIEYQARLRDWIATRITGALVTRLGTQGSSLFNEGVTVTSGYEFGFIGRLRQTPKSMLCGTLAVSDQSVTIVDMHQFAEDVANGVPNARLVDYVPAVRSTAGLRFAWAASRTYGVTLLGSTSYGDAPRRQEATSWGWDLGASVDYDAAPKHGIPLGAALAYRLTSLPGLTTTDNGNSSQTVLRIAYTGRHDLVAVDILGLFDRQNTLAQGIWAGGIAFSMRAYF